MKSRYVRGLLGFSVFCVILLGFRFCGWRDEVHFQNERAQRDALFSQEAFLLKALDEMERGAERDWLGEAAERGLTGYASVRWDERYRGVYLMECQGFPAASGILVTRECVDEVYDSTSQRVEVYGRGEEMYVYRLTYYWD